MLRGDFREGTALLRYSTNSDRHTNNRTETHGSLHIPQAAAAKGPGHISFKRSGLLLTTVKLGATKEGLTFLPDSWQQICFFFLNVNLGICRMYYDRRKEENYSPRLSFLSL